MSEKNVLYTFNEFADLIVQNTCYEKGAVICITGPSSVGKSTLAHCLARKYQNKVLAQVICGDNYLRRELKGKDSFRKCTSEILEPDSFDWELLKLHVEQLKKKERIFHDTYVRGVGWGKINCKRFSNILIIEGLFLDSVQASNCIIADMFIEISADDELIKKARLQRDGYYRERYPNFKRTESESLEEIKNTIIANKIYKRVKQKGNYLKVFVDSDFMIKIIENDVRGL